MTHVTMPRACKEDFVLDDHCNITMMMVGIHSLDATKVAVRELPNREKAGARLTI